MCTHMADYNGININKTVFGINVERIIIYVEAFRDIPLSTRKYRDGISNPATSTSCHKMYLFNYLIMLYQTLRNVSY